MPMDESPSTPKIRLHESSQDISDVERLSVTDELFPAARPSQWWPPSRGVCHEHGRRLGQWPDGTGRLGTDLSRFEMVGERSPMSL